ncbi:unnamed protein product [Trichogramma brassicae]|uniref:FAS1 domain-containing protein n=1 Tax=Trichogramma brassicae TaxID=86971 RepID=A0A6H5J0F8_9HYME|nr:unnamed protein product [Trichogramma brassicae]
MVSDSGLEICKWRATRFLFFFDSLLLAASFFLQSRRSIPNYRMRAAGVDIGSSNCVTRACTTQKSNYGTLMLFQTRSPSDPRPRLSVSQQTQILSDVQQHREHYVEPPESYTTQVPSLQVAENSTPYSALARYKVDRKKQTQQIQQQLQSLQNRIQQQQQQLNTQLNQHFPDYTNTFNQQQQHQHQLQQQQQQPSELKNAFFRQSTYQTLPPIPLPNLPGDFSTPFFNEQQNQQLQEYYEKQRQLEILQRQREQLLLEQQELRRQQELLRLQQLQLRTTLLPTTTTSTTSSPLPSSVTSSSILLPSPTSARKITASENDIFLRAIATHQKKFTTTTTTTTSPNAAKSSKTGVRQERVQDDQANIPKDLLALIQQQQNAAVAAGKPKPQIKFIYQTEKPQISSNKGKSSGSSSGAVEKDSLLKQLKLALSQSTGIEDTQQRNVTTRDIVLPNGKKLQVIQAGPNGILGNQEATTIKPPKALFDELTKGGIVPAGADFEVLRQNTDGKLDVLGNKDRFQSQPAKKVTFVVLEEQPDGSYKVQGVKGNADKDSNVDVDSIVERIKKGELKLPPPSTSSTSSSTRYPSSTTSTTKTSSKYLKSNSNNQPTTFRPTIPTTARSTTTTTTVTRSPYVSVSPNSVSTNDKYVTSASSISGHVFNSIGTTAKPALGTVKYHHPGSQTTAQYSSSFDASSNEIGPSTTPSYGSSSTGGSTYSVDFNGGSAGPRPTPQVPSTRVSPLYSSSSAGTTGAPQASYANSKESLSTLLRREGLFAMAKYLRQSGLDSVLNETGPYTIFVPTDKAFRTLLVQLGGPEKAEQKFRDNPRLLSGLLLHHVVPGAFRIESLQDEMTGVSLAGTQLRVNVYSMHDHEWNDIRVTTINGARVAPNKRDVEIPQGLAHAIDRVMFPLPVGDLVQTLQADRERRFQDFLKLLRASGMEETLQSSKTFTVFAPTDQAFEQARTKNGGAPVWQEQDGPEAAKEIVLRHVIPTTLYTAGMRYYHQKETLRHQVPLQIQKTGGRIRVNEGHIITYNVPATNGVLHAIDTVM